MARGVPAYQRHRREFSKSNPVYLVSVLTRKVENDTEVLERARERAVI